MKISKNQLRKIIKESIEPQLLDLINSSDVNVARQGLELLGIMVEDAYTQGDLEYVESVIQPIFKKYGEALERIKRTQNAGHTFLPGSIAEWDKMQQQLASDPSYQQHQLLSPGQSSSHLPPRQYAEDLELVDTYRDFLVNTMRFWKKIQ